MGVFSTREKADEYVTEVDSLFRFGYFNVDEIELDVPFNLPSDYRPNE
jgi:hypothetical protein